MAPALLAITFLIGLSVLGIALGEPDWLTPAIALTIVVIGTMFGVRGGFAAALLASACFFGWAVLHDGYDTSDLANHRHLLFFALGLLTGYFAHGALGDYHLGNAMTRGKLRHGMRTGQVVLHYQPMAEAESGKVTNFEALVRWEHPDRGTVLPADFVPVAEDDDATIWELTLHTLRLAIEECGSWQKRGYDVGVSVNLSSVVLSRGGLADEIARMVSEADLPAHHLTLEVTESAVMGDPTNVAIALARVRSVDTAAIAIDDFGTGYSSLARLEQLPLDTLKIDQLFMRRSDEEKRRSMLGSIIELAHGLGLSACAEGVEDRSTWEVLVGLGCDTVQGYTLSRPLPPEQLEPWLERTAAQGVTGR